ncbi:MAG: hypothetical protein WCJ81_02510 [bacterium]
MKKHATPATGTPTSVWIIEMENVEKKLPNEVALCLKNLKDLSKKEKADILMRHIHDSITQMGKNQTQSKEICTCMSRLNLLIRRICKDVVQAEDEDAFASDPYIQTITDILGTNSFSYNFRQSVVKPADEVSKPGKVTKQKEFA